MEIQHLPEATAIEISANPWLIFQQQESPNLSMKAKLQDLIPAPLPFAYVSDIAPINPAQGTLWREVDTFGYPVEDWYRASNNKWLSRRKTMTLTCGSTLNQNNRNSQLPLDTSFLYLFRRAIGRLSITSLSAQSVFFNLEISPSTLFINLSNKSFNPLDWSSSQQAPGAKILYYQEEINLLHDPYSGNGIEAFTYIVNPTNPQEYLSSFSLDYHLIRR
jgi:hypothetical protein